MSTALWKAKANDPPNSLAMRARLTESTTMPESPNEAILAK